LIIVQSAESETITFESENGVLVKKYGTTTAVYVPFASSNVTIYDFQGKKINSFFVKVPSWKTISYSSTKGKMSIVRIIAKSGKEMTLAVK
jgi:hypothetical protein